MAGTLLLFASAPAATAQADRTGVLTGVVADETDRPIAGASVRVEGTNLNTLTNRSGYYRISGVPVGVRTIRVEHLGYESADVSVDVAAGETSDQRIALTTSPLALDAVVVEGRRYAPAQALNEQRTAASIRNIVSAEQAERYPDTNLPDALRRMPGVAVDLDRGEAGSAFIRGLAANLTTVTIDGQRLAPTGAEGQDGQWERAVNLSGIPIEMMEGFEVIKAITPDMDADAVAGSINLRPRSPRGPTMRARASAGRHSLEGDPAYRGSFLYGNRVGRFGFMLDGSYSRNNVPEDDLQHWWIREDFGNGEEDALRRMRLTIRPVQRDRYNLGGTVDARLNERTSLFVRGFFSRNDSNEERHRHDYRFDNHDERTRDTSLGARIDRQGRLELDRRDIFNIAAGGDHTLRRMNLDYRVSVARSARTEDRDHFNYRAEGTDFGFDISERPFTSLEVLNDQDPFGPENYDLRNYEIRRDRSDDGDIAGAVNASVPFSLGSFAGAVRMGGQIRQADKRRDYLLERVLPTGSLTMAEVSTAGSHRDIVGGRYRFGHITDWDRGQAFADQNVAGWTPDLNRNRSRSDPANFGATERISAGYLMSDVDFGAIGAVAGVRYEHTAATYDGNRVEFDDEGDYLATTSLETETSYGDLFPMAHLRFRLDERSNVRLAWTRTIARPNFSDLAPYEIIDDDDERISLGNPELEPAQSQNLDLLVERYFASVGVVSAGVFFKQMNDFAFEFRETIEGGDRDGWEIRQPRSGDNVTVVGAEIAWQQRLTFLRGVLSGLGVMASYTFSDSEADFGDFAGDRTLPLPELSRHVANAALTYDVGGFGSLVSLSHRSAYLAEIGDIETENRFWGGRTQIDASARQEIVPGMRVFLDLVNLTNAREQRYWGPMDVRDYPSRGIYHQREARLGLSYSY